MKKVFLLLCLVSIFTNCSKRIKEKKVESKAPNNIIPKLKQNCEDLASPPSYCTSTELTCMNNFIGSHTVVWKDASTPSGTSNVTGLIANSTLEFRYSANCGQMIAILTNPPCGENPICFPVSYYCQTYAYGANGGKLDFIYGTQNSLVVKQDPKVTYTCAQNGAGGYSYNGVY